MADYDKRDKSFGNLGGIFLLKVNNRNTRTKCKICSELTIKTPELRQALILNILPTLF